MERRRFEGALGASESANGGTFTKPLQPNYSCMKVQKALEHLASIDLMELCNEAKVEYCRATRDLRSCGRYVQCVLNSCGHASLCEECSQRCDICPICRISLPKDGNKLRLRLYNECIEAGLISKRCDDRFQEKEDGEKQITADVQRLYSIFDVAIDNNLVSLICHYVTDVCLDESAVSSDPIIAFLLDEAVAKDWCKRAFKNIIVELQRIYNFSIQEMEEYLDSLLKYALKLSGISNVLEILESSFKNAVAAQLQDLHHLHESILKTKQHVEMMIWCIRHRFLENVKPCHTSLLWRSVVNQRKSAAIKRTWPDFISPPEQSARQHGSLLFIEEALLNLDAEQDYTHEMGDKVEIASLHKDGDSSFFRSKREGMAACYPFENLRAATDILFLHGSSDLVVAKRAIFLYYLFDRHWAMHNDKWREVIDDFAVTFGISRHSLLESFTFYLLDDHSDEALQEACSLLPEISGPSIHPKVAQVLLERQKPDAALMVLRWSGRDSGTQLVSLGEAVTAVRVRVECGLLTEAFMHQRTLCTKVKEENLKHKSSQDGLDESIDGSVPWTKWVEALVTEICYLCIRRNLVSQMIELPWNSHEEKHIYKCLLDFATDDLSSTAGSLLVVFYLQRYRYIEAYQVDQKLQSMERDFLSKNPINEEVSSRMTSASDWRARLVGRGLEVLPEVVQQQVKSGKLPEEVLLGNEVNIPPKSDLPIGQGPVSTSLLLAPSVDSSLNLQVDYASSPSKPVILETPSKVGGSVNDFMLRHNGYPVIPYVNFFDNAEKEAMPQSGKSKNFKFNDVRTPARHRVSPATAAPLKEFNRSLSRAPRNSYLQNGLFGKNTPAKEHQGLDNEFQNATPYSYRTAAESITSPSSNHGVFKFSAEDSYTNVSSKLLPPDRPNESWNLHPFDDLMEIAWSQEDTGLPAENINANGGPRWRSDDTSEDEEQPNSYTTSKRTRTRRFARQ